jgi:hypothetical protein
LYRDWKAGIHGKRTGYFEGGQRMYMLCVHCHNPHDPAFRPLKPEPPPHRPYKKERRMADKVYTRREFIKTLSVAAATGAAFQASPPAAKKHGKSFCRSVSSK